MSFNKRYIDKESLLNYKDDIKGLISYVKNPDSVIISDEFSQKVYNIIIENKNIMEELTKLGFYNGLNKNYYSILGVDPTSPDKEIKKKYYKLSFDFHPDRNKNIDISEFNSITEAYNVLCSEDRKDYDLKSKFGNNYNEYFELFEIKVNVDYDVEKEKFELFKKNEVYNIQMKVDGSFDGSVEYERWVRCKSCDGTGKDLSSKIIIKDANGNSRTFDADDGCDYCEGTGKDFIGNVCHYCHGKGKVGITPCKSCGGEKRVLGKQKLTGIKLVGKETKIDAMGHYSKNEVGKVGYLLIIDGSKLENNNDN